MSYLFNSVRFFVLRFKISPHLQFGNYTYGNKLNAAHY